MDDDSAFAMEQHLVAMMARNLDSEMDESRE